MRHGTARTAGLSFTALAVGQTAMAETFLTCRFPNGGQLRVVVEERGLAVELPGQTAWLESEETGIRRDPLAAGFGSPLPGEGWRGVPAHDRFTLSLSRVTGEARLIFSRRPDPAQVEACRAAAAARPADQPPSMPALSGPALSGPALSMPALAMPVPCEVPIAAGSLAGTCEVQRLKF